MIDDIRKKCSSSVVLLFLALQTLRCTCEVIRLNSNNFDEHVLEDTDPWIVGIREKVSDNQLEDLYDQVKDRVNIGAIDEKEFITLLQDLDAPADSFIFKQLRIYPFGARLHKLRKWENVESISQAEKKAVVGFPDITNSLPNIVDAKNAMLRDFIQQSYANLPPKFPVVLFTNEQKTPLYYKLIALRFSSLFHFAVIRNPPVATLAVYAITKLPRLVVLLTEILQDGTPRIKPITYAEEIHGSLDYPRVMRFLYLVHMKYFKELPGHTHTTSMDIDEVFGRHLVHFPELLRLPDGTEEEAMKDKLLPSSQEEDQDSNKGPCNEANDVCLIIIGKNLHDSESQLVQLNEIAANLSTTKKQLNDRGKSIAFHQLDLDCNEETETHFDIYSEDVPVVLLMRPRKHLYAVAVVDELPISIEDFVQKALAGKIAHQTYENIPEFKFGKCEENTDDHVRNMHARTEL